MSKKPGCPTIATAPLSTDRLNQLASRSARVFGGVQLLFHGDSMVQETW
jgi:hypothetical protein